MERKRMSPGGVAATVITVLLCLSVLVFVGLLLVTIGPEYGFFDMDDILFEWLSSLGSSSTNYEKTMSVLRLVSFGIMLVLGGSMLLLFLSARKKREIANCGKWIFCSCLIWSILLFDFMLLLLYDFHGLARTMCLILIPVLCAIAVFLSVAAGKHMGIVSLVLTILGLSVGFWLCTIFVSFVGVLLTIFGDIAWIIVLLSILGGGCGSSRTVYIIGI